MSLLDQVLKEMEPYGGIVQLDKVDALKRNPKAVALPFTRYMLQRTASDEHEEENNSEEPTQVQEILSQLDEIKQRLVDTGINPEEVNDVISNYINDDIEQ